MKNFTPNDNFFFYLYFIQERMNIFWKRYNGEPLPYTEDEILKENKFTNVYRCLDRESQFLIKNVIYNDDIHDNKGMLMRILLFRHFNSGNTWNLILNEYGDIKFDIDLQELAEFLDTQKEIYNKAYMLTSRFTTGKIYNKFYGMGKYHGYFDIFSKEIFCCDKINEIFNSVTLEDLYKNILTITGFGSFTAYQLAIDLNYSTLFDFNENDFVEAGLGAKRGIERCFNFIDNNIDYNYIINWVLEYFDDLVDDFSNKFSIDLTPKLLNGRFLKLIDIQNCFCETGKYLKMMNPDNNKSGEKRMSHKFYLKNKEKINYMFPPKWNIEI